MQFQISASIIIVKLQILTQIDTNCHRFEKKKKKNREQVVNTVHSKNEMSKQLAFVAL